MPPFVLDEFHPNAASEDEFRARWELVARLDEEDEPESPVTPFDKHRQALTDTPSFQRHRHWTAWEEGRTRALGYAVLELEYTDTNRHLAWMWVGVAPEARRLGIGTALLGLVAEAGQLDGRTILGCGTIEGSAGDSFCDAFGFERKATERKSRLLVDDMDRALLDGWVGRAAERAADYELITIDDRVPDDVLEPFVELWHVTNTAPRDDLEMEDELPTPEQFREREEKALANGQGVWRVIARHRETGQLAGFSELFFAPYAEDVTWQGWTAVHPSHRDRGLGRWVKAANAVRLLDERPTIRFIDTWNAFSNAPMLAINTEMGFKLLRGYNEWQAPTDRLSSAVKERSGG